MFDFILQLYSVTLFKHSVQVISAAHHVIREPSRGNLLSCYRFTLWLSTKAWECDASICSTLPPCLMETLLL